MKLAMAQELRPHGLACHLWARIILPLLPLILHRDRDPGPPPTLHAAPRPGPTPSTCSIAAPHRPAGPPSVAARRHRPPWSSSCSRCWAQRRCWRWRCSSARLRAAWLCTPSTAPRGAAGRGPVMAKTVAGTMLLVLASAGYSIAKIRRRAEEHGQLTPTDQVLASRHLLEASLMGIVSIICPSLFVYYFLDRSQFEIAARASRLLGWARMGLTNRPWMIGLQVVHAYSFCQFDSICWIQWGILLSQWYQIITHAIRSYYCIFVFLHHHWITS